MDAAKMSLMTRRSKHQIAREKLEQMRAV